MKIKASLATVSLTTLLALPTIAAGKEWGTH